MAFTVGKENKDLFTRLRKMTPIKRLEEFKMESTQGSTRFSLLTPQQFAELFPRYYMEKMPDVGGFFKALSSKKELGGEGQTYGPHGNTGTATPSSNERVTNLVKAKEIYDYLRAKGVDHVHATGIVNNMKYESSFNSGAMGDGNTSGGLFQHHASRFTAMKQYVGEGWQTNWKKQIDFALTESEMKTYLGRNLANAQDASMRFTQDFEKPLHTDSVAAHRAGTAEGYASAMLGKGGEPSGGQTPGGNYEINSSGYIMPRDKTSYDPGNEQQCATLVKGLNPDVGRSSSWTVVPGDIKPGVAVATMRYNLPGGDRTGSGYHSGIAMSAPDSDGNFMLLEQFNGQPPRVRQVNLKYGGGAMGGSTQFGLISSNGRLHDEQSVEALRLGAEKTGDEEMKKRILSNADSVSKGDTMGSQTGAGNVSVNQEQPAGVPGPQTNLQQQQVAGNIQTATIGDMMRMVGDLAGFFTRGEGMGDGRKHHRHRGGVSFRPANAPADPNLDHVRRSAIEREAKNLNVDPHHLATAMLFESIGSLNPERMGVVDKRRGAAAAQKAGAEKRFMGLIQMGSHEQRKYGVKRGQTFDEHMVSVGRYLKDRGVRDWMDAHPNATEEERRTALYSAINAGRPEEKHWKKTDKAAGGSATTVRQKSAQMADTYGERARKLLSAEPPRPTAVAREGIYGPPTPAQEPQQTAKVEKPKGKLEQMAQSVKDYFTAPSAPAQEVKNTYAESAARMKQMKPEPVQTMQPLAPNAPEIGDKVLAPEFDTPQRRMDQGAPKDNQSFNMSPAAPASKPISIDAFNDRPANKMPTESLARAMQNTRDPTGANKDHDFMTSVGSFG